MIRKINRFVGLLGFLAVLALWPTTEIMALGQNGGASPGSSLKASPQGSVSGVDGDYHVGPGDVITVSVWKEPEVSTSVVIRPDGKISIPLVNDLAVDGRSPMEIQNILAEKLSPFIQTPNVTVTVKEINSKKVFVLGEVNRAAAYQITQPTTVLQILTEAGGVRPFAKQKSIYVLRTENGKQAKFPFNYKDVVKGEKIEQNILLRPGDTVVVP